MAISVTSAAAEHVSKQLQARGRGEGIRIAVKTSGCSGLAYVLEFVDTQDPEDTLFETDGVRVFVDPITPFRQRTSLLTATARCTFTALSQFFTRVEGRLRV